jgi:metal-responsive CopG/Arc/MetJ family transcriptional regulator
MRTTLTLDDDVAAEVERLRREEGIGVSEAVNRLIRMALATPPRRQPYEHISADLGIKVDVTNIGDVLELLDES